MRILVVSNLYPPEAVGGWELGCAQMVEELRRRGHDVRVLTSTARTGPASDVDQGYVHRVLDAEESWDAVLMARDTPAALIRRLLVNAHNVDLLRQEIETVRPDVVYVWNLIGLGAAGIALAIELRGAPWVAHLMDAMPRYVAAAAGAQQRQFGDLLNRRLGGVWIACSQGLVDEITATSSLHGRVEVVPNWVVGPRPPLREAWFHPGRTLRCVYTGQVVASKGIGLILNAIAVLRGQGHSVLVDVYGEGADRAGFEAHAIGLGVQDDVRFRGLLDQRALMSKLSEYDVMLYPTEPREPFGFAPLEAAAAGCVPLVTAGSGITEWLVEDVHLLTIPRDADSLVAALRKIITGDIDLAPVGTRGQRVVLQEFHIEAIAPRVERLLQAAAERHAPAQADVPWPDIVRMARIAGLLADRVLFGR